MARKKLTVRGDEIVPGDIAPFVGEVIDVQEQPGRQNIKLIGVNGTGNVVGDEKFGISR